MKWKLMNFCIAWEDKEPKVLSEKQLYYQNHQIEVGSSLKVGEVSTIHGFYKIYKICTTFIFTIWLLEYRLLRRQTYLNFQEWKIYEQRKYEM